MDKAETIFHQLLEVDGFDERRELAHEACGADDVLRVKVKRFLPLHK